MWDRACAICAKTRMDWRWPYVVGSERASWARRDVWDRGRVGSCGIGRQFWSGRRRRAGRTSRAPAPTPSPCVCARRRRGRRSGASAPGRRWPCRRGARRALSPASPETSARSSSPPPPAANGSSPTSPRRPEVQEIGWCVEDRWLQGALIS